MFIKNVQVENVSVCCVVFGTFKLIFFFLSSFIITVGMTPVFAQESSPQEMAIVKPYNFTYTITDFANDGSTVEQQEELVRFLFEEFWGEFIPNVNFIYVKDANPDDVFGLIQMNTNCGKGVGCGGGQGANTWCVAGNATGSFFSGQMELILAGEIGHCLGLDHYGGFQAFDCMMVTFVQPFLTHCDFEINDLQNLWLGAVCTIPECMDEGTSVTNARLDNVFSVPNPVLKGDIVTIHCQIHNVGNTMTSAVIWTFDWTDNNTILPLKRGQLNPGETKNCPNITMDTTNLSLGLHEIELNYLLRDDIDKTDNRVRGFIVNIVDTLPEPSVDYTRNLSDTLTIIDNMKTTLTILPIDYNLITEDRLIISDSITSTLIKGFQLPSFEELVEMVRQLQKLHGII